MLGLKAMNFQVVISSIPINKFKDQYGQAFDLTSMQEANGTCHYLKLVGEPMGLELNFTFRLKGITDFIELGKQMSSVAVDRFGIVGKNRMDNIAIQQKKQLYLSTQVSMLALIPFRLSSSFSRYQYTTEHKPE